MIRIKMMGKEITMVQPQNAIAKSSIRSAFLMSEEAIISLSYNLNNVEMFCESRIVLPDLPEPCFLLPEGWPAIQFVVESNMAPSRMATPMAARPFASPYPEAPSPPPPVSKSIDKWMFYGVDSAGKSTVVCVHPRYYVTFRHGTHLLLEIGSTMKIFHARPEENQVNTENGYDVTVVDINESLDFVLLRSDRTIVQTAPRLVGAEESETFLLAGFGDVSTGTQQLAYVSGIVHSVRGFYFYINDRPSTPLMGPFYLGTGQSSRGDSGGACFSARGLIGINYGVTSMPDLGFTHRAICEASTFSPKNIISPSLRIEESIMAQLRIEQRNSPQPPPSKRLLQTEIDGLGSQTLFVEE